MMDEFVQAFSSEQKKLARWLLSPWILRQWYHRVSLTGLEHLPEGPAVVVSNHSRLDFDSLIFVRMVLAQQGILLRSLADRMWFSNRLTASVAHRIGAVEGTRAQAHALLKADEKVLAYPGGVREIFASRYGHDSIRWEGRMGYARIAHESGVPVIPIVGLGGNRGFVFLNQGRWAGRFLYNHLLRQRGTDYRDPLTLGLVPLPLPYSLAVHFPMPCKVRYEIGQAIDPKEYASADDLHDAVSATMGRMLT